MELLVISDSKLKIMLDREDMEKHGLFGADLDYDDPATRKKLLRVLDEIKGKCGFDTAADKLLIQLYPSKDGGSEMFVTKLGPLPASAEQSLKHSRGVGVFTRGTEIYFTKHFSSLISIARALGGKEVEESRVYYEEPRGYYLVIEQRGGGGALSPLLPAIEFADPVPASLQPYIEEYASLMIGENALNVLRETPV
jgi:negative regulator of genetic competence, sporulation and motility